MIEFLKSNQENVLSLKVTEKITKEDVDEVVSVMDNVYEDIGKVAVILYLEDIKGYTLTGFIEDLKNAFKYNKQVEKMAIVGDKKYEEIVAHISNFIMKSEIKYFDMSEKAKADEWIHARTKEFSR